MSTPSLPPWDQLSFSFGWDENITTTIPQCYNISFEYYNTPDGKTIANPPPSPPYSVVMYGGGFEPYLIPINNTVSSGKFRWVADLPVGPSFAVSMKDSKGYTGGIIHPTFKMTTVPGCNVVSRAKASSLGVEVTGNSQCGQTIVNVKNGTAPYTLEIVPLDDRQQKTIHFASSPFGVTLDMSEGVEYFLAIYDSANNSAVMGSYNVGSSSDNGCLGAASTVSAGKFSTLYPGGTATATSTGSVPTQTGSKGLPTSAVIGIAVSIPTVIIFSAMFLLWFCYKRNRRQRDMDATGKLEIEPQEPGYSGYSAVPTFHPYSSTYDVSNAGGSYHPPAPVPYPIHSITAASDRQTVYTDNGTISSGPNATLSEKRRHLVNPDQNDYGSIVAEPFDPRTLVGPSRSEAPLPALPPAYSPS